MGEINTYICTKCGHTIQRCMSRMKMSDYSILKLLKDLSEDSPVDDVDDFDFEYPPAEKKESSMPKTTIDDEFTEMCKIAYRDVLAGFHEKLANDKPDPEPTVCDKCGCTELKYSGGMLFD